MATTKLKSIELVSFRGASQQVTVEFAPDKKVTMIYGENGSGKSSIVDGFAFICERSFGSLNDRKGASTDLLTSIAGKPELLRVKLATETGTWEGAFKPRTKTIVIKPENGCPDARILRRSNILRIIDEIPSKRFEALKGYIDVSGVEKCEKALGDAIRSKETELSRYVQSYTQAHSSLLALWLAEKSPGASAEEWAAQESRKDLAQLQTDSAEAEELVSRISQLQTLKETRERFLQRVSNAETELKEAVSLQRDEEQKIIAENPRVLELLRRAQDFITNAPSEACPICRQPVDSRHLASELQTRISAMGALSTATTRTESSRGDLDSARSQLLAVEVQIVEAAAAIDLRGCKLSIVTDFQLPVADLDHTCDHSLSTVERVAAALRLLTLLTGVKVAVQEQAQAAQKTIFQWTGISTQLNELRQSRRSQETVHSVLSRLRQVLEIVGATRKAFVKEVLDEISAEVQRLYGMLHPDESVGGIKLSLDPENFGSLYLRGDFHSAKDVPPQSIFSESHLDTLGFCVFLALAKRYKTDDTIIILDDVLNSIDAQHLDRFIRLIHEEEHHFSQVIIATHYRPWCDRYRYHRAPGNKVHFIELRSWALQSGIHVQQIRLAIDELSQALKAPYWDRQIVASKAGIFLEAILEFLARLYESRLPLTGRSVYTLGELTSCFSKKLLPALKVERLTSRYDGSGKEHEVWDSTLLAPLISQVKQWADVRNLVGCHFNELGAHCTDKDVEELAKAALALGEALICAEGGDLPCRDSSGSYYETRSKKVRLHPFAEPN